MKTFPSMSLLMQATNRAGFEMEIAAVFTPAECDQIMRAYRLSKYGHRNQWRDDGSRYFDHPKQLALMLVRLGCRHADVIIIALLHDIIEDSFILLSADVGFWFGLLAQHYLTMVTKDKKAGMTTTEYFARMLAEGGFGAWLVKCIDRLHNLSTLPDSEDPVRHLKCVQKKFEQAVETRTYVIPLAEALSQVPGFEELGHWFIEQLNELCNMREKEAEAG